MYRQTQRCLAIIAQALNDAGADVRHVVRTRIMPTDMSRWREPARAHGEIFADPPGLHIVEVSGFIDPEWFVEIEASAVIASPARSCLLGRRRVCLPRGSPR